MRCFRNIERLNTLWIRAVLFTIHLLLFTNAFSQKVQRDTVSWTRSPLLTFRQFQASPGAQVQDTNINTATHELGFITTSIYVNYAGKGRSVVFSVYAVMQPTQSWIRHDGDTITLKHEQGHFDLCEVYARRLRRDLHQAKSLQQAKAMFNHAIAAEAAAQTQYDTENTYGAGGTTAGWRAKIRAQLKCLEQYRHPTVLQTFAR